MQGRVRRGARVTAGASALALILGVASIGVANAQSSDAPKKVIFNVGTTSDMVSPNPFKACCGGEYEMMFMNYDMLLNFSKTDLTAAPGLAESYTHNANQTSWTFKIRSGVTWSDGEPLTAEDVAFTFNFILDNKMGAFISYLDTSTHPTFSAPDASTFVWTTEAPTIAPTTPPWLYILPEHVWSTFDGDPKGAKEFANVPAVGSGPFHLVSWDEGQGWKMTANKDYWGGSPTIDEVDFHVFSNQEGMTQALKAGQIDFADAMIPSLFKSLQNVPDITTNVAPPGYFDNLAFNFGGQGPDATNLPALHDVRVRQAIAYAIDTNAIVDKLMLGYGTPGESVTLPGSPWYWQPPADQKYTFDIQKANQILDDAGYTMGPGGVRVDPKTGDPLEIDTLTLNNLTYSQDEGKLIKDWLRQIGIELKLVPVSESKAYDLWGSGDYDAYIWDWGGDPDPDFILSIFTTDSCLVWSDGCYSDPAFDKMYLHQKTILDPDQRRRYIDTMQAYLNEKVPEVVLAYENDLQAYRSDRFTGYIPVPSKAENRYLLFGWGPWSYINLKPVAGAKAASSGISTGVWIAALLGLVVIGGAVVLIRRRTPEEERA